MPISVAECLLRQYNTACIPSREEIFIVSLSSGGAHPFERIIVEDPRAIKINDPPARDPWRYRSWIPIYPFFLPFYSPLLLSADDITASILQLIPTVPFVSHMFGTFKRIDILIAVLVKHVRSIKRFRIVKNGTINNGTNPLTTVSKFYYYSLQQLCAFYEVFPILGNLKQ